MLFKFNVEFSIVSFLFLELKEILVVDKCFYCWCFIVKKKDGIKLLVMEKIVFFEVNGDFCWVIDD